MTSRTSLRALPCLALFLLPFAPGCLEDHPVGEDLADAATGKDAGGCVVEECNEPDVPVGCHLGEGTCVDGHYQCPEVICPGSDASVGCVNNGLVCNIPPIPSGCTLGPRTCVNGEYQCPTVICPDAGPGCANDNMVCSEPPIPSGCSLGPSTCVDGVYQCPAVICPDGGTGAGDAGVCVDDDVANYDTSCNTASDCAEVTTGNFCSPICTCGGSTVNVSAQAAVQQAVEQAQKIVGEALCECPAVPEPKCVSGKCVQPTGSLFFGCGTGSLTCDSDTQYCFVVAGGPISPDGGTSETASCQTIPAACTGNATCACLETQAAGTCTVTGSGITMQEDAP